MAAKKNPQQQAVQHLLAGLGIGGDYHMLIVQAVQNDWDTTEFLHALTTTRTFRQRFPGLIQHGRVAPFLSANPSELSASNLGAAIRQYGQLQNAYHQVVRNLSPAYKITPQRMGALISGQISPDEFGRRAEALRTFQQNPGLRETFNEQLQAAGKKPLDQMGFFKFLANASQRSFYDVYESAYFRTQLGLNPQTALEAARQIGGPLGAPAQDLNALVSQVRSMHADIAPELQRIGVSDADLLVLASNQDPKGLAPKIQQIINQRRTLGQPTGAGQQVRTGSGGGAALYGEQQPASY